MEDKKVIKRLCEKIKKYSESRQNKEKIEIWKKHNACERIRPLVLIFEIPWNEVLPENQLECKDEFTRKIEFQLRVRLFYAEKLKDDSVIDDKIYCQIIIYNTGFGIERNLSKPEQNKGAVKFNPVIKEEKDIEKLQKPKITVDWKKTEENYQKLCELVDGILKVEKIGINHFWFAIIDQFVQYRGIDQFFVDMVERPDWVHRVLNFMTECKIEELKFYQENGLLSLNNGNHYIGSGGFGFTDQLPQPDFSGKVRSIDLWGHATTQIFSLVSPFMHEEFALKYEKIYLENFGLNCYGCCEPLDKKIDIVFKNIPRLRRISMSPWVDVGYAAEKIGKKAIFSWKPNPSVLASETFDIEKTVKDALDKTKNNVIEIIMKDIHTCRKKVERLIEWVKTVKNIAESY